MSESQSSRRNKEIERRKEMTVRRPFDDLFDNFRQDIEDTFFAPLFGPYRYPGMSSLIESIEARTPLCDVVDKGDRYLISLEIPGIKKDKMDIKASDEYITISAKSEEERKEEDRNYILNERTYSSFFRKISFQENIIPNKIEATLEDGILKVELPKQKPTNITETQIKIK